MMKTVYGVMNMIKGCDMIVGLTHLPQYEVPEGIEIKRAFVGDRDRILAFVREKFSDHIAWPAEVEHSLMQDVCKCFVAVENNKMIGFACFDVSAKSFFGPIGVDPSLRGKNLGKALLIRTLEAMRDYGYGYAIIGWVDGPEKFYQKAVGAQFIHGGEPENSVYSRYIDISII